MKWWPVFACGAFALLGLYVPGFWRLGDEGLCGFDESQAECLREWIAVSVALLGTIAATASIIFLAVQLRQERRALEQNFMLGTEADRRTVEREVGVVSSLLMEMSSQISAASARKNSGDYLMVQILLKDITQLTSNQHFKIVESYLTSDEYISIMRCIHEADAVSDLMHYRLNFSIFEPDIIDKVEGTLSLLLEVNNTLNMVKARWMFRQF